MLQMQDCIGRKFLMEVFQSMHAQGVQFSTWAHGSTEPYCPTEDLHRIFTDVSRHSLLLHLWGPSINRSKFRYFLNGISVYCKELQNGSTFTEPIKIPSILTWNFLQTPSAQQIMDNPEIMCYGDCSLMFHLCLKELVHRPLSLQLFTTGSLFLSTIKILDFFIADRIESSHCSGWKRPDIWFHSAYRSGNKSRLNINDVNAIFSSISSIALFSLSCVSPALAPVSAMKNRYLWKLMSAVFWKNMKSCIQLSFLKGWLLLLLRTCMW